MKHLKKKTNFLDLKEIEVISEEDNEGSDFYNKDELDALRDWDTTLLDGLEDEEWDEDHAHDQVLNGMLDDFEIPEETSQESLEANIDGEFLFEELETEFKLEEDFTVGMDAPVENPIDIIPSANFPVKKPSRNLYAAEEEDDRELLRHKKGPVWQRKNNK